jgi:hypothetical protein
MTPARLSRLAFARLASHVAPTPPHLLELLAHPEMRAAGLRVGRQDGRLVVDFGDGVWVDVCVSDGRHVWPMGMTDTARDESLVAIVDLTRGQDDDGPCGCGKRHAGPYERDGHSVQCEALRAHCQATGPR